MVALRLKELRALRGITQQQLSEVINISQQSISRYESGKHYPDIDTLVFIADYFNVPLDLLVDRKWPNIELDDTYEAALENMDNNPEYAENTVPKYDEVTEHAKRIVGAYKASEEIANDFLRLDVLSDKGRQKVREFYDWVLSSESKDTE